MYMPFAVYGLHHSVSYLVFPFVKAFYQLCQYMEPDYFQLEFDLRAYLCWLEMTGKPLWADS